MNVIVGIVSLVLIGVGATNDDGWLNVHWGMKLNEIANEMPGGRKLEQGEDVRGRHNTWHKPGTRLYLLDYDFGGRPAAVMFLFDDTEALEEVDVCADGLRTREYITSLLLAMETKYGPPTETKRSVNGLNEYHVWMLANNTIQLHATDFDGDIQVELSYRRGIRSLLNKK